MHIKWQKKKIAFCENFVSVILFLKISLPRFIIGKVELNKRNNLIFFMKSEDQVCVLLNRQNSSCSFVFMLGLLFRGYFIGFRVWFTKIWTLLYFQKVAEISSLDYWEIKTTENKSVNIFLFILCRSLDKAWMAEFEKKSNLAYKLLLAFVKEKITMF